MVVKVGSGDDGGCGFAVVVALLAAATKAAAGGFGDVAPWFVHVAIEGV